MASEHKKELGLTLSSEVCIQLVSPREKKRNKMGDKLSPPPSAFSSPSTERERGGGGLFAAILGSEKKGACLLAGAGGKTFPAASVF